MTGQHAASLARPLDDHERAALREAFAAAIASVGVERALTRPAVLPDERHFPDAWAPSARGVGRVVRRLMRFAGLPQCALTLESEALLSSRVARGALGAHARVDRGPVRLTGAHATADGDMLTLAVDLAHLDEPDFVVASSAREVARAHLLWSGRALLDADPAADLEHEERVVDVTAVALGLGVLVANAAHHVRATDRVGGGSWRFFTREVELAALGPRAFAYLLALWSAMRGVDVRVLAAHLETNQAEWMQQERARLDVASLAEDLALPAGWDAPAQVELDVLLGPVSDEGIFASDAPASAAVAAATQNRGRPVFCVPASRATQGTILGAVAGGIAVVALPLAIPLALPFAAALVAAGTAAGFVGGKVVRRLVCSDPACDAEIPAGARHCPGCGGVVAGHINSRAERLTAEERWRASAKPASDETA